jgi:G3E family GTPase
MKIKVDVFSGFLGAGKTRLIKKLIEENYYNEQIAIIENEFGEVSIDGEILRKTNTRVTEINSGCICCQVSGDFKKSLLEVVESYKVDRLIIEPTGVAKLTDLKKTFEEKEFLDVFEVDKLITVVDCEKFNLYLKNFKNFYVDQIRAANLIILSRVQNISNDALLQVKNEINKINNNLFIIDKIWDNTHSEYLMAYDKKNVIMQNKNKSNSKGIFKANKGAKLVKEDASNFQTFAVTMDRSMSKEELINKFKFISNNDVYGQIIRAKGIVNINNKMGQFDFTLNEFSIEEINYSGKGIISFIGVNLNKQEISKFFL